MFEKVKAIPSEFFFDPGFSEYRPCGSGARLDILVRWRCRHFASKYIWRGQRLTNDWSLQPAATVGIGNFSFNAWGSLDITAVNEGDALPIPENPFAPDGASGLKGKFSEIDYTFSYSHSLESVSIDWRSHLLYFSRAVPPRCPRPLRYTRA